MAKPTSSVDWASGGIVTEPPGAKKTTGWLFGEEPFFDYFNWIQRTLGLWTIWLQTLVFPDRGTTNGPPAGAAGTSAYSLTWETSGGLFVFQDNATKHRISQYTVTPGAYTEFQTGALVLDQGSIDVTGNLVLEGTNHRMNLVEITVGAGVAVNSARTTLSSLAGGLSELEVDYAVFADDIDVSGDVNVTGNLNATGDVICDDLNVAGTGTFMGAVDCIQVDSLLRVRGSQVEVTGAVGAANANVQFGTNNLIKACGSLVYLGGGAWAQSDGALNVSSCARTPAGAPAGDFRILLTTAITPLNTAFSISNQPNAVILSSRRDVSAALSPVTNIRLVESYAGSATEILFMVYDTTGNLADPPIGYILNFMVM